MSRIRRIASAAALSLFTLAISAAIADARHRSGGGHIGGVRAGGFGGGGTIRGGFSSGGYRSGIAVQPRFGGTGYRSGFAVQPRLGDGGYRRFGTGGVSYRLGDRHRRGWDHRRRYRDGFYYVYVYDWGYDPWFAWGIPVFSYYEEYYEFPPVTDEAIAECKRRFRSYDPVSRTYLGYDGLRHPCP
jgi:hypothetical protein